MNLNLTLFMQAIVLFVLGWVTMKFIWPPLMTAIADRQRKIAEGLAAAEKGEKSLIDAKTNADVIVREARQQATKIIDQANRRQNEMVDEARVAASAEGQRLVAEAKQEVALQSHRAREQLRQDVAALVVAGTSQLIGREVDARAHADLLEKLAREIERG
jgi:F-type H+-transporting ATPase subunit b